MANPDWEQYAQEIDEAAKRRREQERRQAWPELYEGERQQKQRRTRRSR
jgi:hypothetical protein